MAWGAKDMKFAVLEGPENPFSRPYTPNAYVNGFVHNTFVMFEHLSQHGSLSRGGGISQRLCPGTLKYLF